MTLEKLKKDMVFEKRITKQLARPGVKDQSRKKNKKIAPACFKMLNRVDLIY